MTIRPELTKDEIDEMLASDSNLIGLTIANRYRGLAITGATGVSLARDIKDVIRALRADHEPVPEDQGQ